MAENFTRRVNVKLSPLLEQQLNELVEFMREETPSQVLRRLIKEAHEKYSIQKDSNAFLADAVIEG